MFVTISLEMPPICAKPEKICFIDLSIYIYVYIAPRQLKRVLILLQST
jgi:hypothetical protein